MIECESVIERSRELLLGSIAFYHQVIDGAKGNFLADLHYELRGKYHGST